jgi:hypothetical protein
VQTARRTNPETNRTGTARPRRKWRTRARRFWRCAPVSARHAESSDRGRTTLTVATALAFDRTKVADVNLTLVQLWEVLPWIVWVDRAHARAALEEEVGSPIEHLTRVIVALIAGSLEESGEELRGRSDRAHLFTGFPSEGLKAALWDLPEPATRLTDSADVSFIRRFLANGARAHCENETANQRTRFSVHGSAAIARPVPRTAQDQRPDLAGHARSEASAITGADAMIGAPASADFSARLVSTCR